MIAARGVEWYGRAVSSDGGSVLVELLVLISGCVSIAMIVGFFMAVTRLGALVELAKDQKVLLLHIANVGSTKEALDAVLARSGPAKG